MKYNINENIEKAEKENNFGNNTSNWFKFKEGANKMRILTYGELIAEKFKLGIVYGKDRGYPYDDSVATNVKWLYYIIDRADGKFKLAKLPHGIVKSLGALQTDPDYTFEGFPMPFDITITATNAGTKEVNYSITPARANTPLTTEEENQLLKLDTPTVIIEKMKDKAIKEHKEKGIWIDPSTLEAKEQERVAKYKEDVQEHNEKVEKDPRAETYPGEDINPEDIPF